MAEKEKGSDAMLPPRGMQHIDDLLYADRRRLNVEQMRVDRMPDTDEEPIDAE